jgi:hypothetical protein
MSCKANSENAANQFDFLSLNLEHGLAARSGL